MPDQKKQTKTIRRRYLPEFNTEALGWAEQVGVAGAAKKLGLHESQLYAWRKKARYEASRSETEKELATENARLKRQVAKAAKKYKATTDSDHSLPVAPNRLEQDFSAQAPNQKWACAITRRRPPPPYKSEK